MERGEALSGDRLIETGWLVLAAGLPLFMTPWARNSFELPKVVLLWSTLALMGAVWLGACRRATTLQAIRDLRSVYGALVLVTMVSILLSTFFSTNSLLSAQGSYERMQGAITLLCYLALSLLVATCLRGPERPYRLLTAISWGSAPVVVYALLQLLGLDPLAWQVEGSPVISFLGRSNFVGAYLVLALPVTIARARITQDRLWRWLYSILIGAQGVCLIATMAQAAWLGALAAGGVLALAEAWQRGHRRLVVGSVVMGGLGLLAGMATLSVSPEWTGSAGARAAIWQATGSLIAARPILGHGPETFGQAFTRAFPPDLVYVQGRGVLVDRAHNLILDTLASVGLVGLLAYAALAGTAIFAGLRFLARTSDRRRRIMLTAGLAATIGHLVETQFSFQVTATATLFWLILGMLLAPSTTSSVTGATRQRVCWPRRILTATLLLTVLPLSTILFIAEAHFGHADRTGTPAELEQSIVATEQAVALWPRQPVYYQHLSWLHLQQARHGQDVVSEYRAAEAALDAAQRLTPGDYRVWAGYGELYTEWGQTVTPARYRQAEKAYQQATSLFPGNAMLHTGWGLLYVAQGRLGDAEAQFHRAASLDHTDATAFMHLGHVQLAQGDLTGAEQAYANALRWAPDMAGAHHGLGQVYHQLGFLELALNAYQQALALTPGDPEAYLAAGRCAWDLGRRELACQTSERGLLLAPRHPGLLELQAACD
ncbi:MAG: tetratricopeptide repeat protein [Anaerolineae bacterium]|jgi:tetratricopeptide (TPR) repeat protein/O-antigen ligase